VSIQTINRIECLFCLPRAQCFIILYSAIWPTDGTEKHPDGDLCEAQCIQVAGAPYAICSRGAVHTLTPTQPRPTPRRLRQQVRSGHYCQAKSLSLLSGEVIDIRWGQVIVIRWSQVTAVRLGHCYEMSSSLTVFNRRCQTFILTHPNWISLWIWHAFVFGV